MAQQSSSNIVCKNVCEQHGHSLSMYDGVLICARCGKSNAQICKQGKGSK